MSGSKVRLAMAVLASISVLLSVSGRSSAAEPKIETVAQGLEHPWGLTFLPDGRMLVTERPGRLRVVSRTGEISAPVSGVPAVAGANQGGLLDVALDPAYGSNGFVYLSFAEPRSFRTNGTSVLRGRLVLDASVPRLENVQIIFRQQPAVASSLHFGSRLVFARDGSLFITVGERYTRRDEAQNPSNHLGKILRIRPDGSVPPDNPGPSGKTGWQPEIWSIGHRNVQGAALHPQTGELWTAEHGAKGGDEINIPRKGKNYGWPVITYGRDYSGAKIGEGVAKAGMEQPVYYYDPSIAPSGMAFYTGDLFPEWKGNIFIGALAGRHLNRIVLDGEAVIKEERLLKDLSERIRDVRSGPDGAIWLLTDSPKGRLLRLSPAR